MRRSQENIVSSLEEVQKCLRYRYLNEKIKTLQNHLNFLTDAELVNFIPQLIHDIYNPNSNWGMRNMRLGKYDGQFIHDFLSPSGIMLRLLLKLESSSNPRFDLKPLKLPESVLNRLFKKSANDELCGSVITELHYGDDGTDKATIDIYASAVSYYLLALFSYIIHPLNRKNDFWSDSSHWFLKLLNEYFEFFMPSPGSDATANVPSLPNLLSHIAESTPITGLMCRNRIPEVEISLSMTKLFTECFVEMLLVPISSDASKLPVNGPSLDHIRVVRMFLRHLHSVVLERAMQPQSHDRLSFNSPAQSNFQQSVRLYDEFYQIFMASTLHTPLINFFSLSILNWPNEMPLRVIAECWLTYLQPWRIKPLSTSTIADNEAQDIATWQSFVETNLVFYTQIFQNLLPHLLRMDPSLLVNCSIIFRIGKVFAANPVLKSIIKENEQKIHRMNNLNNQTGDYKPMFCIGIVQAAARLIETCIQALWKLKNKSPDKESESDSSFWKCLFSPSMSDENAFDFGRVYNNSFGSPYLQSPGGSKMSVVRQLEEAINTWCALFDIDRADVEKSLERDYKRCSAEEDAYPEHVMGELGPELTAKGRWQIITGRRKFNHTFAGDPDLQPVKSFEFAFLVRLCLALSNFLNEKYRYKIEKIYNREDWLCNIIKFCFIAGPLKFSPQKMAPQKSAKLRSNKYTYSPHVTLRFMASYHTLIYFVLSILLCHFLMPSWLVCMLVSVLLGFVMLFCSTIGSTAIDTS